MNMGDRRTGTLYPRVGCHSASEKESVAPQLRQLMTVLHVLAANHADAGTSIEACMQGPPGKSTWGLVCERDVNRQREVAGKKVRESSTNLGPLTLSNGS